MKQLIMIQTNNGLRYEMHYIDLAFIVSSDTLISLVSLCDEFECPKNSLGIRSKKLYYEAIDSMDEQTQWLGVAA